MRKITAFWFTVLILLNGCSTYWDSIKPRLSPPSQTDKGVMFEYYAPSAKFVTIAGDFNRWGGTSDGNYNPNIGKMYDDDTNGDRIPNDGIWTVILDLKPGRYQYKFVVDGVSWNLDPSNPETSSEGGFAN